MHMHEDDTARELLADVKHGVRKTQPFFPTGRGAHDDAGWVSLRRRSSSTCSAANGDSTAFRLSRCTARALA